MTRTLYSLLGFASLALSAPTAAAAEQPNVLLILADDLGFSDVGCYGGEIVTPNLDQLAAGGLRFRQYYNGTRCCPSRASLMTGLYPHQAGVGDMNTQTAAAGYHTSMVGKWHLSAGPKTPRPTDRGFDDFYGMIGGFNSCFQEDPFYTRLPASRKKRQYPKDGFYSSDVFGDYSIDFLAEARKQKKPFFQYLAFNAPHFPLHAKAEDIKKYTDAYAKGWDEVRETRLAKQIELGLFPKGTTLSPLSEYMTRRDFARSGENPAWATLDANRQADLARRMAVFAAMVTCMDRNIGRVVDDLQKNGELDNTLILFLSDNGACAEWDPFGFDESSGPKNVLHKGDALAAMGGPMTYHSYGSGWANAGNAPFRLYKHYCHEGGHTHPAHRPLAERHLRERGIPRSAGAPDRRDGDLRRTGRGEVPGDVRGPHNHTDGGDEPDSGLRQQTAQTRTAGVGAREEPSDPCPRSETRVEDRRPVGTVRPEGRPGGTHRSRVETAGSGEGTVGQVGRLGEAVSGAAVPGGQEMNRALVLGVCLGLAAPAAAADKPNVLVIVGDDMGYADLGVQGCKDIPTPHLDALAKSGVRFTSGYVSGPYCSPTRAGLLTGRYQTRFGHEFNPANGPNLGLPLTETTMADRLKAAGYRTGLVGKWHLGTGERHPQKRGFDEFFGFLGGAHDYFNPMGVLRGTEAAGDKTYLTDALAREAVAFIDRNKDKPFFLYLAFNAVHTPMQADDPRLKKFAAITDPKRRTYAAMMSAMDDAVGEVVKKLKDERLIENTLVVFFSDNGGPTMKGTTINGSVNTPLRGSKRTTLEGGVRVPFFLSWPGQIPAGGTEDRPVIQLDLLPTALAAARVEVKPEWKLDGVNLMPYLTGKDNGAPHDALYWRFGQQMAIRKGDWKMLKYDLAADNGSGTSAAKLYNLKDDVGEAIDLTDKHPEKVKELQAVWDAWNKSNVAPLWGGAAK